MENQRELEQNSVISLAEWIVTLIVTAIPLVGFIMLFVWAFGSNSSMSKANWAKATLILYVIGIVLVFVFWGTIAAIVIGAGGRY